MSGLDADTVATADNSRFRLTATEGVLAIAFTTALDAISTIAGLSLVPVLVERNPLARRLFDAVGLLAGIVIATAVAIVIVAAITESAVHYLEGRAADDAELGVPVRLVGYGIPSIVSLSTALHNLALLVTYQPFL